MPVTCLDIATEFCKRTAQTIPSAIFASNDDGFVQLAGLMNEGLDDLTTRHTWGVLQQECLVTTLAAEDQGDLYTLAPGFINIVRNEIYDRTVNLKLNGPVSSSMWQAMKAAHMGGELIQWRVRLNHLMTYPPPAAGHILAFEYASNFAVLAPSLTPQKYFTSDTDQLLLPERLMYAWLRWRWKAEKGFVYNEEFRLYEILVAQAASQDNEGRTLDMSPDDASGPGIFVPAGSWVGFGGGNS
jgi:hypothetical protein